MKNLKLNIIKDYDNLDNEHKEKFKLVHPNGFGDVIVEFTNNKKKKVRAIRWETDDKIYLLRLSNKMLVQIMEDAVEMDNKYS